MKAMTAMVLGGIMALALALSGCGGAGGGTGFASTTASSLAAGPVSGAIFTTDNAGGVNINIFGAKTDVYLNGGPAFPGAAGLPDGDYYAQVTQPNGDVLGRTETPVITVSGGEFAAVYNLWNITFQTDSAGAFLLDGFSNKIPGYGTSGNNEYKVWASMDPAFPPSGSKTDNFRVLEDIVGSGSGDPPQAVLNVHKFYDANANGVNDDGQPITGWLVNITDGMSYVRYTPASIVVSPDTYTVSEGTPLEAGWMPTTPASVNITLNNGDNTTVEFGNLCVGPRGGKTLGFWSNRNGQAMISGADLAMLVALNLRNANGSNFDPGNYSALRSWLLNATATNMAYMLSAQLAAMELNVYNGLVNGSAMVYAPGTTSANSLGFATVNAVMAEANAELGTHGTALSADAWRAYQEALKNALDKANNNLTFVQATPCPFTF